MGYVKIEYGARPGFFRPGQKRFIVPFDQADRAVNRFDMVCPEILPHVRKERREFLPRHIQL